MTKRPALHGAQLADLADQEHLRPRSLGAIEHRLNCGGAQSARILDDQDIVGTVTLGPGNIDPVNTFSHSSGATLGLVVDVGHITTLGPSTPPTVQTITVTSGIGSVSANTVFIGAGAVFKAFEEPDFYANKNVYPDVVVGLTSMFGNYAETNVLSNSPLLDAFALPS